MQDNNLSKSNFYNIIDPNTSNLASSSSSNPSTSISNFETRRSQSKSLISAVFNGRTQEVEEIIINSNFDRSNLNSFINRKKGEELITLLMLASKRNHPDCVKALINHGSNINIKTKFGNTALMLAVKSGHNEVLLALINTPNLELNEKNNKGASALVIAIENNQLGCALTLINAGCNVNVYDQLNNTAKNILNNDDWHGVKHKILLAQNQSLTSALKFLESNIHSLGINSSTNKVNIKRKRFKGKRKPTTSDNNSFKLSDKAWGKKPIDVQPNDSASTSTNLDINNNLQINMIAAIMWNESQDLINTIKQMGLRTQYFLNVKISMYGNYLTPLTPLMWACTTGKLDCAKVLIEYGASINEVDSDGNTALIHLINNEKENLYLLELLLNQPEINLEIVNFKNQSALLQAIDKRMEDSALMLLNHGAKWATLNRDGDFLRFVERMGLNKIVEFINSANQDIPESLSPLSTQQSFSNRIDDLNSTTNIELVLPQVDQCERKMFEQNLYNAVLNGEVDLVRTLLEVKKPHLDFLINAKIQSVDKINSIARTALMLACICEMYEVAKFLIDYGADINDFDVEGNTALIFAAESGDIDLLKLLLNQPNIDFNHCNLNGECALDVALSENKEKAVELIIDAIFNFCVKHNDFTCLVSFVSRNQNLQVIEKLKQKIHSYCSSFSDNSNAYTLLSILGTEIPKCEDLGLVEGHFSLEQADWLNLRLQILIKTYNDNPLISTILSNTDENCRVILLANSDNLGDINYRSSEGVTPLLASVFTGKFWTTQYLLEKGANKKLSDNDGNSALSIATTLRYERLITMLG